MEKVSAGAAHEGESKCVDRVGQSGEREIRGERRGLRRETLKRGRAAMPQENQVFRKLPR
ncbi:hypothetical protein HMPREF9440_02422 [Sutterella parvirubra YIT 11816]|uniref:Uncharacterized protein n=1 Tax=Sutterella parvirubra YIT 11816 TaxID=762967 RepID=H3KI20_9BURK|nr:hypothetical protein HMPREF9440_02422 [Sutterella parvirubra YIT 11816]